MKQTISLKKSEDFGKILKLGKWCGSDTLSLYILKNNRKINILGIAIPTKTGKSTKRNRIKRLIREAYRLNENNLNMGNTFVVVWKPKALEEDINYQKIEKDLLKCLSKAGVVGE